MIHVMFYFIVWWILFVMRKVMKEFVILNSFQEAFLLIVYEMPNFESNANSGEILKDFNSNSLLN